MGYRFYKFSYPVIRIQENHLSQKKRDYSRKFLAILPSAMHIVSQEVANDTKTF